MKQFIIGSVVSVLVASFTISGGASPKEAQKIETVKVSTTVELIEKSALYTKVETINAYADSIDVEIKKLKQNEKDYK